MRKSYGILLVILANFFCLPKIGLAQSSSDRSLIEGRAVWANPGSIAYNDSAVQAFVANCVRANINLIVLIVEWTDQAVYYHSKKFPESISPGFKEFDPLAAVIREAHKHGIRVHAWLCSFTAGDSGPVMHRHPEWAMRNAEGKIPTEAEYLSGGTKYYINWMCPARRPGFTDQWMLPMIEEIVSNYDVDGIHHDYVRYPGDVAPDGYCFCDYCLEDMLKYAHFYYEAFPDSVYEATPTLPNHTANWWSDPTVKPKGWVTWDRKRKTEFFLKGSFMKGGPSDLDYFFYTYRQDAINRFVREAWERASAIKPNIEMSAAVFKNPIASGRFIGQRWTDFSPWIDILMPMVYRSHFPPRDYDTFLKQLEEYTRYEYQWAKGRAHLSMGIDVHYIYNEETLFLSKSIAELDSMVAAPARSHRTFSRRIQARYALVKDHLAAIAPETANALTSHITNLEHLQPAELEKLRDMLKNLNTNPPDDYFPKAKLRRAIEAVRKGGAKGIVVFDAGGLTGRKLWPALEEIFKEPSSDPETVASAAEMSIVNLKMLRREIESGQRTLWVLGSGGAALLLVIVVLVMKRNSSNP